MPVSGSIGHAIGLAMISYTVIKVFSGKAKEVSVLTYVISALFLLLAERMNCSLRWINRVERGESSLNWRDTLCLLVAFFLLAFFNVYNGENLCYDGVNILHFEIQERRTLYELEKTCLPAAWSQFAAVPALRLRREKERLKPGIVQNFLDGVLVSIAVQADGHHCHVVRQGLFKGRDLRYLRDAGRTGLQRLCGGLPEGADFHRRQQGHLRSRAERGTYRTGAGQCRCPLLQKPEAGLPEPPAQHTSNTGRAGPAAGERCAWAPEFCEAVCLECIGIG